MRLSTPLTYLLTLLLSGAYALPSMAVLPTPAASATAPPAIAAATAASRPKLCRTVDDVMLELVQVPDLPANIEAKAHEVARLIARSKRKEAEAILSRLIPEAVFGGDEIVEPISLERVHRVVVPLLRTVAVDKDDTRAALAIHSLSEWAKIRKQGTSAQLILDRLAEDPAIRLRPKRLRVLERVQARLEISKIGE